MGLQGHFCGDNETQNWTRLPSFPCTCWSLVTHLQAARTACREPRLKPWEPLWASHGRTPTLAPSVPSCASPPQQPPHCAWGQGPWVPRVASRHLWLLATSTLSGLVPGMEWCRAPDLGSLPHTLWQVDAWGRGSPPHVGDLDGVPGPRLWPGPAPGVAST